ncbi:MAG: crotonase/enoyl-CoA hydratase family protein [Acidimicrobiales bacterium]
MSDESSPAGPLQVTVDHGVAVIRLDDGKANAIGHEVIEQFHLALDRAQQDATAVVVVGRPGRFSAGFDLAVMQAGDKPLQDLVLAGAELMLRIYAHPQPTVAACTGHALAGGAILLMACDTRIGSRGDFKIGLNEVGIGMALPTFAVELARDRLAGSHLVAATTQGVVYDPEGAVAAGYLDSTVDADQTVDVALAEGLRLSRFRRGAVAETKARLRGDTLRRIRSTLVDDIASLGFG